MGNLKKKEGTGGRDESTVQEERWVRVLKFLLSPCIKVCCSIIKFSALFLFSIDAAILWYVNPINRFKISTVILLSDIT